MTQAVFLANLSALVLDFVARQKIGGTHLTYFLLKQFPLLAPNAYAQPAPWTSGLPLGEWLGRRVLELVYTAWDLQPFARDLGYEGPPFVRDPERRFALRCELDAAFFHLYGIDENDAAYILDTFPIVRQNDEKQYGHYRTKDAVLNCYRTLYGSHTERRR